MEKRSLALWQFGGYVFTSALGTLLHFLYDLTGESVAVSFFSAVNESTWEHMKIAFWPMFIFAIIQSFYFKDRNDYWNIKLKGILFGIFISIILI